MSDEQDRHIVDLLTDELALARAQLAAGLPGLAEGTLRRRISRLEADSRPAADELDAARTLLAEALWRQHRLAAARSALDAVRPASPQRRLPVAMIVEAETLAAAGELDRAQGTMERVIAAVGIDEAFALRAGQPGRLSWPPPAELRPEPVRAPQPPWLQPERIEAAPEPETVDEDRTAAGRGRLDEARAAYAAGELERGDAELSIALRFDPSLAADGVAVLEPTLGAQPGPDRLVLYGDLLRAAGRDDEANRAFDRAAGRES